MKLHRLYPSVSGLILCLSLLSSAHAQQGSFLGLHAGPTLTDVSSLLNVNNTTDSRTPEWTGISGYHAGLYGGYAFSSRFLLRAEAGYERLRFYLGSPARGEAGIIHHKKLGVLMGYQPLQGLSILGGIEATWRTNERDSEYYPLNNKLNGKTVDGFYWQGIIGVQYEFQNHIQIGLRMTMPKIASLEESPITVNHSIEGKYVYQLRAYQMSVGIPLMKKWLLYPFRVLFS